MDEATPRVSWAQNGEDIRLWRAFEGISHGHYVEVGGFDPELHSTTRSFYEAGWSGLVVEPIEEHAERFAAARPRDIVERVAAGDQAGEATLEAFVGTGLSTLVTEHAQRHRESGLESETRQVRVATVQSLLDMHRFHLVHFMIIDVEGFESAVVKGLDLARVRPWIIVVEATDPLTTNPSWRGWEPGLVASGYVFVVSDGVNRYYVAEEHRDLAERIETPPNPLDGYVPQPLLHALWEAKALGEERDQARAERDQAQAERDRLLSLRDEAAALHAECDLLRALLGRAREERDDLLAQRDDLLAQRDDLLAQRDDLLAQRADWLAQRDGAVARSVELNGVLEALVSSRSWRITAPLRAGVRRGLRPTPVAATPVSAPAPPADSPSEPQPVSLDAQGWKQVVDHAR